MVRVIKIDAALVSVIIIITVHLLPLDDAPNEWSLPSGSSIHLALRDSKYVIPPIKTQSTRAAAHKPCPSSSDATTN